MSPLSPSRKHGTNTPTSVIVSLEETLSKLDDYKLPEEFKLDNPPTSTSNVNGSELPALINRYEKLREGYLESQIQHGVLEHLRTQDWNTVPNDGSENLPELEAQHAQMTQALQQTAEQMITAQRELETDYQLLQQRKEELRDMLQEFRCKEGADEQDFSFASDLHNSILAQENNEEDEETVQRGMAEHEEILSTLQKRKMELQAQLSTMQREAAELEKENVKLEADLVSMEDTETLEKENTELQNQLNKLTKIKSEYDHRRLMLEVLSGIQVESIEDEEKKDEPNVVLVHVTLVLLGEYQLRATLECPPRQKIRVSDAFFVSDPNPGGFYLPPINDLLPTARDYCPGILQSHNQNNHSAGFRFLVHQALGRLQTYKDRQKELDDLGSSCHIEVRRNAADPEDHLFQKVVCVIPWKEEETEVTVVVRLTPDCPTIPGSLFLESLSSPTVSLDHLQARVISQQSQYASLLKFITSIKSSLATEDWKQPFTVTRPQDFPEGHTMEENLPNGADGMWEC